MINLERYKGNCVAVTLLASIPKEPGNIFMDIDTVKSFLTTGRCDHGGTPSQSIYLLHGLLQFGEPLECDYPNVGIAVAQGACLFQLVLGGSRFHLSQLDLRCFLG
jgi:hypothetical protein